MLNNLRNLIAIEGNGKLLEQMKFGMIDLLQLLYTLGPIKWFLDKECLKKGYEEITADLDESEKRIVE